MQAHNKQSANGYRQAGTQASKQGGWQAGRQKAGMQADKSKKTCLKVNIFDGGQAGRRAGKILFSRRTLYIEQDTLHRDC